MVIMEIVFVLTALAGCLVLSITLNEAREGKGAFIIYLEGGL